jgi:hypothetical protein
MIWLKASCQHTPYLDIQVLTLNHIHIYRTYLFHYSMTYFTSVWISSAQHIMILNQFLKIGFYVKIGDDKKSSPTRLFTLIQILYSAASSGAGSSSFSRYLLSEGGNLSSSLPSLMMSNLSPVLCVPVSTTIPS